MNLKISLRILNSCQIYLFKISFLSCYRRSINEITALLVLHLKKGIIIHYLHQAGANLRTPQGLLLIQGTLLQPFPLQRPNSTFSPVWLGRMRLQIEFKMNAVAHPLEKSRKGWKAMFELRMSCVPKPKKDFTAGEFWVSLCDSRTNFSQNDLSPFGVMCQDFKMIHQSWDRFSFFQRSWTLFKT